MFVRSTDGGSFPAHSTGGVDAAVAPEARAVETSQQTSATHIEVLQRLARALADCEPGTDALFRCVAEHLNGAGFGFDRVAVFRDGTGTLDTVPVAQHG